MKKSKGFTIIELLVVIAVIGLLSSIVLVSLGPVRARARDGRRMAEIRSLMIAMEVCYDDYDCDGAEVYYEITAEKATAGPQNVTINEMFTMPEDPTNSGDYVYKWLQNDAAGADGAAAQQYYCAYATLEAVTDGYFCASNKGVKQKVLANYTPSNGDCCGMDVD